MAENNNSLVWVGVAGIAGYVLYKQFVKPNIITPIKTKHYVQQLRVNIPTVRFKGDNIEFDMYIQNPNDRPMTVRAIVGDVFTAKYKLGNISRYGITVIKPISETKFTFSIRLKVISLVAYFSDMFAGKVSRQQFTFRGSINIDGRLYPVTQTVAI